MNGSMPSCRGYAIQYGEKENADGEMSDMYFPQGQKKMQRRGHVDLQLLLRTDTQP